MKSALEIVAFSYGCELTGSIALLETALRALDRSGQHLAAAYVDMALNSLTLRTNEADFGNLNGDTLQ